MVNQQQEHHISTIISTIMLSAFTVVLFKCSGGSIVTVSIWRTQGRTPCTCLTHVDQGCRKPNCSLFSRTFASTRHGSQRPEPSSWLRTTTLRLCSSRWLLQDVQHHAFHFVFTYVQCGLHAGLHAVLQLFPPQ